ncbi:MAG TPA: cysteine--tRNA ligase [Aggregatilineales bacterium]|nr:cysteine--tRNA ligase [Anaerolineales bacterium]HRE48750.1 cysteine--tRNA ligase [Aggregatilineales bacterium]
MALRIFNVLHREKEDFTPITPGRVAMYVCGPTVQDYSHIGHAKTYASFDLVVRYLRYSGYDVLYIQNLTDVGHLLDSGEDRVIKKARQSSALPMQIVETYTRSYFEDMDALGIVRPDISPRASGHIPEQIAMTETLIQKGYAYVAEDGVYFDVGSYPEYGKLSNRKVEEGEAGSRALKGKGKRNPEDFALWILAGEEHILQWESPWGRGYPGWHIECSAMATKYLGATFDIHGGGIDNIFPHNECEIAQSEAANGVPFANYWMLVGSLTKDGQKMSKSIGNVLNIKDALRDFRPEVIRYFIYQSHYSNPIDYSREALNASEKGWERLMSAVRLTREKLRFNESADADAGNGFLSVLADHKVDFNTALDDDFNAPSALAALQNLTGEVNKLLNSGQSVGVNTLSAINAFYTEIGWDVLRIIPPVETSHSADAGRVDGLVRLLIEMRKQARQERQFARADGIRDQLKTLGIALEDRPEGTIYRLE